MIYLLLSVLGFCFFMLIRNNLVHAERCKFIEYFYNHDKAGYAAGKSFETSVPSYDEMLLKFWVWPLDSFYPAYKNRNNL